MTNPKALRIIFAGTPEFAERHLDALLQSHHQIVAVYTQPDRPAGRGKKLQASPVKQTAIAAGIEVQQPLNFKTEESIRILESYNADLMVVVAYGLLLPSSVLNTPRQGCINVHASLLPRWRGAAPIQRCIEAGDDETGITIMQMDVGLDTGDMLLKTRCPIHEDETGGSLHDRLAEQGPPALLDVLAQIADGTTSPEKQDDALASYAHKLTKQEAVLDWNCNADELLLKIRAFNPFPVAVALLGEERVRVHQAKIVDTRYSASPGTIVSDKNEIVVCCGDSRGLTLERLQLPGKKNLHVKEVLNGSADKFRAGTVFNSIPAV